MITEILQGLGSWTVKLEAATPRSVIDQLGYFGHLAIVDGPVDVQGTGDGLLLAARYVGVLRERDTDARTFGGSGMVFWLGDEDDKGDLIENELTLTSATLAQAVAAILPTSVPAGTVYPQPDPAARYTGSHRLQTRRKALSIVCDAFGVEFRVNGNGTVDVGTQAQLYQGVPRTDGRPTAVLTREPGADIDLVALEGQLSSQGAVYDYSSRVVLVGQTTDAGQFATGAADAPGVPYRDLRGNPVKSTRLISESSETIGSVAARSQLQLNRFNRVTQTLRLQLEDYVTEGTFEVGDLCYVFDPDAGIFDPARELLFRGDVLNPDVIRVTGVTWPPSEGQTVAFRTGAGVWVDLTPFVAWETGGGEVTIGDLPGTLTRGGDDPLALRVDASRSVASTARPNPPTGLALSSFAVLDPRTGLSSGGITADWNAPTTNEDGSVPANVAYYVVQWKLSNRAVWASTYTTATDVDVTAILDMDYDVQVAAVSAGGVMSTWVTAAIHVTRDLIGPPAPADPTVDGDGWAGQLRVTYTGFTATGTRMPADTNRVDVHVGATAGFTHSPATLHSSLTPFGSGVDLVEAAPGTTRWIKLVPVDHTGNEGTPSAAIAGAARQIRDGDVLSMSVSKLLAGTVTSDIVIAGRIGTALTGARRELNAVGFQAWDASNALTISLDGVNNLLTGRYRTALTGRRLEMGPVASSLSSIDFYSPEGIRSSISSYSYQAAEVLQMDMGGTGRINGWNGIQITTAGNLSVLSQSLNNMFGGVPDDVTGAWTVSWLLDKVTGSPYEGQTVLRMAATPTSVINYFAESGQFFVGKSAGNVPVQPRLTIANLTTGFMLAPTGGFNIGRYRVNNIDTFTLFQIDPAGVLYFVPYDGLSGSVRVVGQPAAPNQSPLVQFVRQDGYGGTIKYYWAGGADTPRLEMRYQSDSAFIPVWAAAFTVNSDRAGKTNIQQPKGRMLDLIRQARPAQYRRKKPKEGAPTPLELGFIANDLPEQFRVGVEDGDLGADLYPILTAAVGAIHELDDRIQALEGAG